MTHNDDVEAGGLGDGDVPLVIRFLLEPGDPADHQGGSGLPMSRS